MNLFDSPNQTIESHDKAWNALIEDLFGLARKGMILGLERLTPYLEKLGHPEKSLTYVHVAGTNGKGSTCAFLASILAQSGHSVAVYSSPHLECLTERVAFFQGDKRTQLSRSDWMTVLREIESLSNGFEDLTFFEVITLAALKLMQGLKPDFAIVEAGLGARLDATRVVDAKVSVLTDVALDHCQFLGDTIEEILNEKLAVIRPGCPLVSASQHDLVEEKCTQAASSLYRIGDELQVISRSKELFDLELPRMTVESARLGLDGEHQSRNALLAAQAACLLDPAVGPDQIISGLAAAHWPGRLEHGRDSSGVDYILDGAHNPSAARELSRFVGANPKRKVHAVVGAMKDKDIPGILRPMVNHVDSWTVTQGNSTRFAQVTEIRKVLEELGAEKIYEEPNPLWAYSLASSKCSGEGDIVLIFGSLILVGELRGKLATCS